MTRTLTRRASLLALLPLGMALTACESSLIVARVEPSQASTSATSARLAPVASLPGAAEGKALSLDSKTLPKEVLANVPKDTQSALPDDAGQPAQRLQGGDKVRIVVYGEDKMSGDYEVDPTGAITIPLAGVVKARGLTKDELEAAVARRLREARILRNPIVTVSMASFRPFYVLGEVERPGGYGFHNGLNAMSAVALAGGYTYRASKSKILIQRAGEKGFTQYALSPDIPIYPGDLISVPERYF